jgi:TonB family protein
MRFILIGLLPLLGSGCSTSQVAPDTTAHAKAPLAREEPGAPHGWDKKKTQLAQLFSDRPDYASLANRSAEGAVMPRVRTSLPPPYVDNTKGFVQIALVVSETGTVEDARIYEASDPRFASAALEAAKAWTFYPGTLFGASAKFLIVIPILFDGRQK